MEVYGQTLTWVTQKIGKMGDKDYENEEVSSESEEKDSKLKNLAKNIICTQYQPDSLSLITPRQGRRDKLRIVLRVKRFKGF